VVRALVGGQGEGLGTISLNAQLEHGVDPRSVLKNGDNELHFHVHKYTKEEEASSRQPIPNSYPVPIFLCPKTQKDVNTLSSPKLTVSRRLTTADPYAKVT